MGDVTAPDPTPYAGSTIGGRYRVDQLIGRGGFAWVFRALDPEDAVVAVKVLHSAEPNVVLRFARETQVLRSLPRTPHVVGYVDHGRTDDGWPYLVLEFVDGISLKEGMERCPILDPRKAATFIASVCEAFEGLHRLGVAHRDVKPENILLVRGGGVKLIDFGLIRDAQGILKLLEQSDPITTRVFQDELDQRLLVGTPEYMAPEQFTDANMEDLLHAHTDTWSDVFSLGVIFYQMLSGRLPFPMRKVPPAQFPGEVLRYMRWRMRLTTDSYIPCPGIDEALDSILRKALHHDPRLRQTDARALKHDILHYLRTGQGVPLDPPTGTVNIAVEQLDDRPADGFPSGIDTLGPTRIASGDDEVSAPSVAMIESTTATFVFAETIPDARGDPTEPQNTGQWRDAPTLIDDRRAEADREAKRADDDPLNPFLEERTSDDVFSSVDSEVAATDGDPRKGGPK